MLRLAPLFAMCDPVVDLCVPLTCTGNAVALLRLRDPVTFNTCANKACLPGASTYNARNCDTFSYCVILGWGYVDDQFLSTFVPVISITIHLPTTLKYGQVRLYKDDICNFLSNVMAPAYPRPVGTTCDIPVGVTDTRLGDEGGPVLCYDGTRFAVQGIIPFNLFGINNQGYNPYVTDVAQYEAWIRNTIATYN
ncbi:hypothetical protein C0Q70_18514 [Pomacea canaliculata]|uniref:Peptidase S1 domain-containing protein n=1 Tax=Pomacea canaliculata TaxID=400727 RepID=A0A2T7NGR4_POMCA|nr:hypothetical protein C0Q70_18514 [Pomacea canaliculata]